MGLLAAVKALLPIAQHISTGQADLQIALLRETVSVRTPADAVAATDYAYDCWVAPRAGKLKSFKVVPQATLTADNTNYATVGPAVRDVGAATLTNVGTHVTTQITGTGDWAVGVEEEIVVTDSATFVAGDKICWRTVKAAAGVAVPICCVSFEVEYD